MYYPEKEKIVSLDILKLYRGGGRGGEHIIQGFEEDELPGDMMSGAELTEIPNLGELGKNLLIPRPDSGEWKMPLLLQWKEVSSSQKCKM